MQDTKRKGFTLVELLVSISIIATLTAILLPNFMGAREKAKDTKKKSDMVALKNSLRLYYNDTQSYPSTLDNSFFSNYAPQMASLRNEYDYNYYRMSNGDAFQLCVELDSVVGSEILDSQRRCSIGGSVCNSSPGDEDIERVYAVCAN